MGCIPTRKKNFQIEIESTHHKQSIKVSSKLFVTESSGNIYKDYEILDHIGQGSYGRVYRAKHIKTGVIRAIKKINKHSYNMSPEEEKNLIKEISILKQLDHPNILKIFEFYNSRQNLFIVSEHLTGGELFKKIIEEKHFSEKVAAHIMKQLLSAVHYCHLKNIVHRDLKPENILIESYEHTKKEFFTIRVIDFGTSEYNKKAMLKEKIGSSYYIAPEVLNNTYNEKCDLWSCGVIMYILLCGYSPFNGRTEEAILEKVKIGKFAMSDSIWQEISNEAKDLIKNLLNKNIEKRLSAEEALHHEWFKKVEKFEKRISKSYLEAVYNNLKNFRTEQKLQQAVLSFLVHNLIQKEEVVELRKVFLSFDENGDGRLTKTELEQGLKNFMPTKDAQSEFQDMMKKIDLDSSGFIEYEEFITASFDKNKLLTEENLNYAFNVFDKDKNGKINHLELKSIFGKDYEHENDNLFKDMINKIDMNGDGEICFEEFKAMMYSLLKVNEYKDKDKKNYL
jgi:calcium-dependent protein kinase